MKESIVRKPIRVFHHLAICLLCLALTLGSSVSAFAAEAVTCWFPPDWQAKAEQVRGIVQALGEESGIEVRPRIAKSYPEIFKAFETSEPNLVYVGSFAQAIIKARNLGTPLVQNVNGKELYSGILVFPKGQKPEEILKSAAEQIAFAVGASSGESSAKAATAGKAAIAVPNHGAACSAVEAGKAKAAVVKNWWWDANKEKFAALESYEIPGVSVNKNPDNVLTASKAVPAEVQKKIAAAAIARKDAFGAPKMEPFDGGKLDFTLELMKKGKIDPTSYSW